MKISDGVQKRKEALLAIILPLLNDQDKVTFECLFGSNKKSEQGKLRDILERHKMEFVNGIRWALLHDGKEIVRWDTLISE
jgi:hypothetical protein